MSKQALSGIKVLEFSEFISGPYCGKQLAGLGAQVIKVEKPGLGDKARSWGPFPQDIPHPEKSGLFLFLNMDKQGITLNLGTVLGMKIFKELLKWADVLVEDNPPKEMKRLGLDYKSLHKLNPSLIVTSITPFGQTGPYRDYRGCDLINSNMSVSAHSNPAEGVPDLEKYAPLKGPMHASDFMGGACAATTTMSAVFGRLSSGLGQHVDLSQQEALVSAARRPVASFVNNPASISRIKGRGASGEGVFLFHCLDGYVCIWIARYWPQIADMMGNPDWAKEVSPESVLRNQHMREYFARVAEWMTQHTAEEITREASKRDIPCSPINTPKDVANNEQLAFREYFVELDHAEAGTLKYPGAPFKLSGTPWQAKHSTPLLGEHNEQVYCQMLGYSKEDLVRMRQAGVI